MVDHSCTKVYLQSTTEFMKDCNEDVKNEDNIPSIIHIPKYYYVIVVLTRYLPGQKKHHQRPSAFYYNHKPSTFDLHTLIRKEGHLEDKR